MRKYFIILAFSLCAVCSIAQGSTVNTEVFAKHLVAVYNREKKKWCSGTLISKDLVLTAAHCLLAGTGRSYLVYFSKTPLAPNQIYREVTAIKAHPLYKGAGIDGRHDIGLVRIEGDLPPGYVPAPILSKEDLNRQIRSFFAVGYGVTSAGAKSPRQGVGILRFTTQTIASGPLVEGREEFLVNQSNKHGACFGDSGGPALVMIKNRPVIVGIASAVFTYAPENQIGRNFDLCNHHSVYTSALSFREWIAKTSTAMNAARL